MDQGTAPYADLGKMRCKGPKDHLQVLGKNGIALDPLNQESSRRQARANFAIKFIRKQGSDTSDPGIRRLGDDHVVLALCVKKEISRIVVDDMEPRIGQDPAVQGSKIGRSMDDGGLYLDTINLLDIGVTGNSGDRHSTSESDDKDFSWRSAENHPQMTEHQLSDSIRSRSVGFSIRL